MCLASSATPIMRESLHVRGTLARRNLILLLLAHRSPFVASLGRPSLEFDLALAPSLARALSSWARATARPSRTRRCDRNISPPRGAGLYDRCDRGMY